ncbi:WXG100 family type VII secretion target [Glycomyces dulcitolivorans]|uniref:WXG100 family type VII secretion target n=1 Tax=Glycomyces dulcitolivorans TaxID=2200759 RepID=UPI0022B81715|nr:WXG100 family type VII secretion target [Glycomyces dulcitolivorans]
MIRLNYAEMEEASQRIIADSQAINDALTDLGNKLDLLEWDDEAAEAYQNKRAEWTQSLQKLNEILEAVGGAVNTAKENYRDTELANKAKFA